MSLLRPVSASDVLHADDENDGDGGACLVRIQLLLNLFLQKKGIENERKQYRCKLYIGFWLECDKKRNM